ncbi:MAG: shikimate kinase [Melioribacteraceae bacterium]|nr:shikimate kinase [Melioribacteraceae bacterium]
MLINKIYLTGFMTCGKSTIGPILANTLGWDYYDLDEVITEQENKSVVQIFEDSGEDYFRKIETEVLERLSKETNVVISLGGGTMTTEENVKILKLTGKIVFLDTSSENIYQRLKYKLNRPLFKDLVLENAPKSKFIARIDQMLTERKVQYSQSDFCFNTDCQSIGVTVDKIANKMKKIK